MANIKISALPAGAPAVATDLVPIDRAGTNYSLQVSDINAAITSVPNSKVINHPLFAGLPNAAFITTQTTTTSSSTVLDLYTVPNGKRALYVGNKLTRNQQGSWTGNFKYKVGGSYYPLNVSATSGAGKGATAFTSQIVPLVLEAGESVAISITAQGTAGGAMTITLAVVEFDATATLKSPKLTSLSVGDNTLYTCPANTQAMQWTPSNAATFSGAGGLFLNNNSGATVNGAVFDVPSGNNRSLANITNLALTSNSLVITVSSMSHFVVGGSVFFNGITNASWTFLNRTSGTITATDSNASTVTIQYTHVDVGTTVIAAGQAMDADSEFAVFTQGSGSGPSNNTVPILLGAGDTLIVNSDSAVAAGGGWLMYITIVESV